eukprot:4148255-Pyramimonas_sp.AAC.1
MPHRVHKEHIKRTHQENTIREDTRVRVLASSGEAPASWKRLRARRNSLRAMQSLRGLGVG